jgi:hypothetical protein
VQLHAEAAAPELVAPARAARGELVLCEVAHEGAEDVEEALHFLWCASTTHVDGVTRHAVLEMTNFGLEPQAF